VEKVILNISDSPILTAVILLVLFVWMYESLRARAYFVRGEKLDARAWVAAAITIAAIFGASYLILQGRTGEPSKPAVSESKGSETHQTEPATSETEPQEKQN
jgi:hypothetical protein